MLRELLKKFNQNFPLLIWKISEHSEEINRNFAVGKSSFEQSEILTQQRLCQLIKEVTYFLLIRDIINSVGLALDVNKSRFDQH